MDLLDLFSGIGGFALGLERAGMRVRAFAEHDAFCRRVLRKHWPRGVPRYTDVRGLTADRLRADGIGAIDVIAAGWPCQDVSVAGTGAGLAGERSGLWREVARMVGELRPRYAILENVAGLLGRGLGDVLGDLAEIGYDSEWHSIPAASIGAPHRRDRVWIVAYTDRRRREGLGIEEHAGQQGAPGHEPDGRGAPGRRHWAPVADAGVTGLPISQQATVLAARWWDERRAITERGWWASESGICRVADGLPFDMDRARRLRALGNSLVPQIAELIGRAVLAHAEECYGKTESE